MKSKKEKKRWGSIICMVTLISGGTLLFNGLYMEAKAQFAQVLIAQAWQKALHLRAHIEKPKVKPWPWADTYPVAKITFLDDMTEQERTRKVERSLYVLAGASGRTMAFGPGHLSATPLPLDGGNSVISGHRDSHFSILQYLDVGDEIQVHSVKNSGEYRVTSISVVHQSQTHIINYQGQDQLTLITCYPFNSILPDPVLRYVVSAKRVA